MTELVERQIDKVWKWAKQQDMNVEIVRDHIKKKSGKKKLSGPRLRFRGPRWSDRFKD